MEAQTSMNGNAGAELPQSSKKKTVSEIADTLGIDGHQLNRFRFLSGIPYAEGQAVLAFGLAQGHDLAPEAMKEVYSALDNNFQRMLGYFNELAIYGLDHSLEYVAAFIEQDSLEDMAIQKMEEERGVVFPEYMYE